MHLGVAGFIVQIPYDHPLVVFKRSDDIGYVSFQI